MADYKNFTETDFEKIKDSLKTYLQSQDKLKDYNFDGSTITMLLNILSYNTQYSAYYGNMLASEKFLNRAQKRKSVVELANNYGYVPYSTKSSTAYLTFNLNVVYGYTSSIVIPKNTKFTANVNDVEYQFYTTKSTTVQPVNGVYTVTDLEIAEGRYFKYKFAVDGSSKFFTLPNKGVDTNRLTVGVKTTSSESDNLAVEYIFYNSILDIDSSSLVYFIQETDNEKYEIYFGDGILGKSLSVGNQVIVEYYVASGEDANNIQRFTLDDDIENTTSISNLTVTPSFGGASLESINSVKLSTKQSYKSQNRAVISSDFIDKIRLIVPNITDVMVWGGEEEQPKQYGKVFYSVVFDDNSTLSATQDTQIRRQLKSDYMVKGITPEFSPPKYSNIVIDVNTKILSNSSQSANEIKSDIVQGIITEYSPILTKFDADIYESLFENYVNNLNKNIIASVSRFSIYRTVADSFTSNTTNEVVFPVNFEQSSFYSDTFTYSGLNYQLYSVGDIVYLKKLIDDTSVVAGTLTSNSFVIKSPATLYEMIGATTTKFYVTPSDMDILISKNNILKLNVEDIKVTIQ